MEQVGGMSTEATVFSTVTAGQYLHAALPGETPAYWATALRNNRRAERTPAFRVAVDMVNGVGVYQREALDQFVAFERTRRIGDVKLSARAAEALQAFGVGIPGGSSTGRKLDYQVSLQADETTAEAGSLFVQVLISQPLLVYRLSLAEAKKLAIDLAKTIEAGERIAVSQQQVDRAAP